MKSRLTALSIVFASCAVPLLVTSSAFAQDECPPGSWFCDQEEDAEPEEEVEPAEQAPPPERVVVPKRRPHSAPPIVVYQPEGEPQPTIVVVQKTAPDAPPRPKKPRWKKEWGVNLRLQGVMLGRDRKHDDHAQGDRTENDRQGMGGLGVGLRYRPIPHFAFEVGLDALTGRDYQDDDRTETALTFNGLLFFNPKDKLQFYGLGGFGFSGAHVIRDRSVEVQDERDYSYFGLQGGLGLEWRFARKTALNFDLVGFVRGRTDDGARDEFEFTDPDTGRQTNTSGGGLARLGLTIYW